MSEAEMLEFLKVDLGITTTVYDARLRSYLTAARQGIEQEGVKNLNTGTMNDAQIVIMYAAWMWRRRDSMEGMPRMLRWKLNNRIFAGVPV